MGLDEYVLSLLAIVSALSVGELVAGFQYVVSHRKTIKLDWLPLLAALHIFVLVLYAFWVSWTSWSGHVESIPFGLFLIPMAQLVCLFFAARTVLPFRSDETSVSPDLRQHYEQTHRIVWGALAANIILIFVGIAVRAVVKSTPPTELALGTAGLLFGLAVNITLAFSARRWVHSIVLPLAFLVLIFSTVSETIS